MLSQMSDMASGLRLTTVFYVDIVLAGGTSNFKDKSFNFEELSAHLFRSVCAHLQSARLHAQCTYLTNEQRLTSPLDKSNTDMRHLTTEIRPE
jgi:hypothetical protein